MKLICDGLDLSEAVLKVVKATSQRTTNPILEGIKLTAKGDSLTLLATDTEIAIEKKIKATVLMEGETVVFGKSFSEFVKTLNKEEIEISLTQGQLKIKYEDSEGIMQVNNPDEFPKIEKNLYENSFTLKQQELKDLISKTVFACSQDEARPILKGCLFEIEDGFITSVALDGFRLAMCTKQVEDSTGNFSGVIPARALNELSRLLDKEDDSVTVVIQKNIMMVVIDSTTIVSRLLEGDYINYKQIIPSEFVTNISVNKNALLEAVERASVFAKSDKYNLIKFDIKEKLMSILSNSEKGNVNEKVFVNLDGKDLLIAFNSRYINECVRVIGDDFVKMFFNSQTSPCVIKPCVGEEYLYLILPVRIGN